MPLIDPLPPSQIVVSHHSLLLPNTSDLFREGERDLIIVFGGDI